MHGSRIFCAAGLSASLMLTPGVVAQQAANPPLPDIRELVRQVHDHQQQLEKVRENYTYPSLQTTPDIDSKGQVKKTETEEFEQFYANGHPIARKVKKNGQPLGDSEAQKETERITKEVEKAEKTPPDKEMNANTISIGQVLEMMDVRNPRRQTFRGRTTIVFDFVGRKDAKTHGLAQDLSKTLQGTMWVDEADREIAHLEVTFIDNFNIGGGIVARIEKGSSFNFNQEPVNGEVWLPTGGEGTMAVRVLLVKGIRQHGTERDYDYKRFHVEAEQSKDAQAVVEQKP